MWMGEQDTAINLVYSKYFSGALIVRVLDALVLVQMVPRHDLHHLATAMHRALALALPWISGRQYIDPL
jgi:hypothetical protein